MASHLHARSKNALGICATKCRGKIYFQSVGWMKEKEGFKFVLLNSYFLLLKSSFALYLWHLFASLFGSSAHVPALIDRFHGVKIFVSGLNVLISERRRWHRFRVDRYRFTASLMPIDVIAC